MHTQLPNTIMGATLVSVEYHSDKTNEILTLYVRRKDGTLARIVPDGDKIYVMDGSAFEGLIDPIKTAGIKIGVTHGLQKDVYDLITFSYYGKTESLQISFKPAGYKFDLSVYRKVKTDQSDFDKLVKTD